MKHKISLILLLSSFLSFAQQYDSLHIEKRKIDKNNTVYKLGKEFVYNIEILKDNKNYYLKNNDNNGFELTQNIDSLSISEIHLLIIKPKMFQRTNKHQTEVYYSYEPNPTFTSSTGIVENEKNTWMHPPRSGFFKSLETCPFPYIKHNKSIGYTWKDKMSIGNYWSDKAWGEWEGRLLLNYEYKIIGEEDLTLDFGKTTCKVIKATASSKIGTSQLIAYYSNEFGFVKLKYTLFNGIQITLDMVKVINGPILRDVKDFFEYKYD